MCNLIQSKYLFLFRHKLISMYNSYEEKKNIQEMTLTFTLCRELHKPNIKISYLFLSDLDYRSQIPL